MQQVPGAIAPFLRITKHYTDYYSLRVWLRELAEEFSNGGYNLLETVGFDISPDQFFKNAVEEDKFVLWDMTKSFPKEYHGTFDVVHIRLVVLALKAEQIKGVVENLVELLSKNSRSHPPPKAHR